MPRRSSGKIKVLGEAAQGMVNAEIHNMLSGKFVSEHDAFLARRIAYVIGGGDVRTGSLVDEDVILTPGARSVRRFLERRKDRGPGRAHAQDRETPAQLDRAA